jgi:hypothetical protein
MGLMNLFLLAAVIVLFSLTLNVESFAPVQRLSTRTSTTQISMAGGRVPLVPYYPNKAQGSKDYQWMDIYNALGRERLVLHSDLDSTQSHDILADFLTT